MNNLEQIFSTETEPTIIKKKQAPQINTISRKKRYNENWRKIIKSRHPEFSKASMLISQYHEISHFGPEYVL